MTETAAKFQCPTCGAAYRVARVEAPPRNDRQLTCISCGGPLNNREGKFALKYFRVSHGVHLRKNGRTSRFG